MDRQDAQDKLNEGLSIRPILYILSIHVEMVPTHILVLRRA